MATPLAANNNCSIGKILALLAALAAATGFYSVHLGADQMWDLENYHLYNPFDALHNRYLYDVAPAQIQTYYNPVLDFPFFFMVKFFDDWPRSIAFVQGTVHGINLLCVALITWHLLGSLEKVSVRRAILTTLALLIGATGGGSAPLIGTTTGDLQAAVPTLAALLFAIRAIDQAHTDARRALRGIVIAGLFAGLAVGAKLTMAPYGVAIAVALVTLPPSLLVRAIIRFVAAGLAGISLDGGLHLFRMWRLFGNPFFPMFNNIFQSPYWEATAARDTRFLPRTPIDWMFYPFEWARYTGQGIVSELPFRDIRLALVLTLGGLAAMVWLVSRLRRSSRSIFVSPSLSALAIFALTAYLIWLPLFSYYRYLIPLELLSGTLIVLAIGAIVQKDIWPIVSLVTAALCIWTTIPLEWGHRPFGKRYVEANAPSLSPDTLVVIVGADPVSYFIPFLDRKVRWVSVMNNFLRPQQNNLLMRRAREFIREHQGPLLMLEAGATARDIDETLSSLSLTRTSGRCDSISSNLGTELYAICPIARM